jgi:hypothetical protein
MKLLLRLCVVALVFVAACSAFYYGFAYESTTQRFRLGLEVDVGTNARSGSSVIAVTWSIPRPPLGAILSPQAKVEGTAPTLDIRPYGRLFAMLSPSGDPSDTRSRPVEDLARRLGSSTVRIALGGSDLPQFAWLPSRDDAVSARRVTPAEFPTVIAGAVRFHGAWIEPTRDPVSRTIAGQFPELIDNIPGKWEQHGAMPQPVFRLLRSNLEQ